MNHFSLVRLAIGFFSGFFSWFVFLVVWFFGFFWVGWGFLGLVDWFVGAFLCFIFGFYLVLPKCSESVWFSLFSLFVSTLLKTKWDVSIKYAQHC